MRPKLSIIIPIHDMPNGDKFLWRTINRIMEQSFKDYEIIITKEGKMAENTNAGIRRARGEIVKILYLDDYLAHEHSLQKIVDAFEPDTKWLVTGCLHDYGDTLGNPHMPEYTDEIYTGDNRIGSPSVLAFRREGCFYFDERLSYLLDCDLYKRYHDAYGDPKILEEYNVVIGLHEGQTSNTMPDGEKREEGIYMLNKYHG
jgi:glycosyltransferase involved in cell wall biosynthesis